MPQVEGKTQADGVFVITLSGPEQQMYTHQIHIDVSATPTAGTITIAGKAPGAINFEPIEGTIDLVNGPRAYLFEGFFKEIEVTPVGFDAGKTYDVSLISK